jgi:hypothetical protein
MPLWEKIKSITVSKEKRESIEILKKLCGDEELIPTINTTFRNSSNEKIKQLRSLNPITGRVIKRNRIYLLYGIDYKSDDNFLIDFLKNEEIYPNDIIEIE